MGGILGNLFDFDSDGNLDVFEQAAEFCFISELLEEEDDDDDEDL